MKTVAAIVAMALVFAAADTMAAPYILNLSGNNFSTHEPGAIGQELRVAGHLSMVQIQSPISLPGITTWSTEYTVYFKNLTLQSSPGAFQRNFSGGVVEIWSQSPMNSPWTPTTPVSSIPGYNSGSVPSTFTDGTMLLRGVFSSFTILDFTQFGGPSGTITNTDIDFVAGSALGELQSHGVQHNWSWSGWFDVVAPVPDGYQLLYGGKLEVESPTPVEASTWGQIKSLFE
jgi:hypothetical protein